MNRTKVEVYGDADRASQPWIVRIGEGPQAIHIMFDTWSELRAIHQNLGFELEWLEA